MNWKKVPANLADGGKGLTKEMPEFKKILLGLKLPNEICLVKLDRIDENGLVFTDAATGIGSGMFFESILKVQTQVKIDYFCEIELPIEAMGNQEFKGEKPLHS